ncbi:MAG: hypothetical protein HZA90_07045 [Verrucomicrobia bacterium]|nr:hypothetical protein [Verrucomicrobiota bacterium]
MTHDQIDSTLRKAPRPTVPDGLRERIEADVALPQRAAAVRTPERRDWGAWLKRWLPALAYGLVLLSCVTLLAVQTRQLAEVRRENDRLRAVTQSLEQLREENADYQKLVALAREAERLRQGNQEKPRWQEEATRLRALVAELPALREENQRLKVERASAQTAAAEEDPLGEARKKAQSVQCISNLKQIGLGARLWAADNNDVLPTTFQMMSNELNTPKILVCPGDTSKAPAATWSEFTLAIVSYEFLAPGISETNSPEIIITRCPIHENFGLLDGSVQRAKESLDSGKLRVAPKNGFYFLTR